MKLWRGEQRGNGSILPAAPRGRTARRRGVGFRRCALAKIGDVGVVHRRSVRQMGRGQRTNWTRRVPEVADLLVFGGKWLFRGHRGT